MFFKDTTFTEEDDDDDETPAELDHHPPLTFVHHVATVPVCVDHVDVGCIAHVTCVVHTILDHNVLPVSVYVCIVPVATRIAILPVDCTPLLLSVCVILFNDCQLSIPDHQVPTNHIVHQAVWGIYA